MTARSTTPVRDDLADRVHAALVAFGRPATAGELLAFGPRLCQWRAADVCVALERLVDAGSIESTWRFEPIRHAAAYCCWRRYYGVVPAAANGRDENFARMKEAGD
jgi:hypothetical protein